jgi:hypothetical protein
MSAMVTSPEAMDVNVEDESPVSRTILSTCGEKLRRILTNCVDIAKLGIFHGLTHPFCWTVLFIRCESVEHAARPKSDPALHQY